jgi:hypothetical protein
MQLSKNLTIGPVDKFYVLDSKNATIKWENDPKWPQLDLVKSEVIHSSLNLISK